MSHTHKDQPGGYTASFLETDGGDCWNTMKARRFGKKFHAREARREAKRITRAALEDAADEIEWLAMMRQQLENDLLIDFDDWEIIDGPAWEKDISDYDLQLQQEDEDARNDFDFLYDPYDDYYLGRDY